MSKHPETKVELTGVHLCCQGCVHAVDAAIASVAGAGSRCNMENGTVTITAGGAAAAQEALDALAAAGFYGKSDSQTLVLKPVGTVPRGKVKRLKISGIHNCCGPCSDAIQAAIATVDGVTGNTVEPRATVFEVTGDFAATALVEALNAAGFSARVEQ